MHTIKLFFISLLILLTTGCATTAVMLSSAALVSSYGVAKDRRTLGTMIDDQTIKFRAQRTLNDQTHYLEAVDIEATSFNGNLLLTGEARTSQDLDKALELSKQIPGVRHVINEININEKPESRYLSDAMLTSKIKSRMLFNKHAASNQVKVVTNNSTAYLMGVVTPEEADYATEVARKTSGVKKVVKLFEYKA